MSKMMDKWLQKTKPGDKGLTRPPASGHISTHKNEVRSIARGYFQNQFRVTSYKQVGRPTHDSIKRQQALGKVTNDFKPSPQIGLCKLGDLSDTLIADT